MKKLITIAILGCAFLLFSCSESTSDDIINPDSDFVYFWGRTCPHCQELNRELERLDMYSLVSIEKRETYFNSQNNLMFQAAIEELGINPSNVGVPFILDRRTREHAIGVGPAIELLSTRIDQNNSSDIESIDDAFDGVMDDDTQSDDFQTVE